ncbi:MAG: RNA-binding protein [Betaproteobacteria bacterium]|nr:RNA-binding protein [Betaproteobacteria bacterium]
MNIFVGNLSRDVTEADLRAAFETFGPVISVTVVTDRETGQARGFAFVDMPMKDHAYSAIAGLNLKALKGRPMTVNEARPRANGLRARLNGRLRRGLGGRGLVRRY